MIRPHYDLCIAWFLGPGKLGPEKATNSFPGSLTYPVVVSIRLFKMFFVSFLYIENFAESKRV